MPVADRLVRRLQRRLSAVLERGVDTALGTLVTADDVVAAYRLLLGRAPDPDGLRTFSNLVGKAPVGDLVSALLCSEEFRRSSLHDAVARRESADLTAVDIGSGLRLLVSPHDASNTSILRGGSYEPHLVAALDDTVAPGQRACIVGGNIGYHVVRTARRVGAAGRVFVFEARPDNVDLLRRNVALNGLDNVLVFSFAVADGPALYRYVLAQGTNGYIEPFAGTAASVEQLRDTTLVQAIRLDDLAPLMEDVDVLQLDVEGAEGLVLRGAEHLLRRCRPTIFLELSPGQLDRVSRMTAEQVLTPLADLGYRFAVIDFAGGAIPFDADVARLAAYARAQSASHVDVKCDRA